jgi:hypothetical protein
MRGVRKAALRLVRVIGALVVVCIAGCTTAQLLPGSNPDHLLATVQVGDKVRAVTRDNTVHEFEIRAIEIGGVLRGVTAQGAPVEVSVADIGELVYRKFAPGRTIALVIGATFGAAILTASCEEDYEEMPGFGDSGILSCD